MHFTPAKGALLYGTFLRFFGLFFIFLLTFPCPGPIFLPLLSPCSVPIAYSSPHLASPPFSGPPGLAFDSKSPFFGLFWGFSVFGVLWPPFGFFTGSLTFSSPGVTSLLAAHIPLHNSDSFSQFFWVNWWPFWGLLGTICSPWAQSPCVFLLLPCFAVAVAVLPFISSNAEFNLIYVYGCARCSAPDPDCFPPSSGNSFFMFRHNVLFLPQAMHPLGCWG